MLSSRCANLHDAGTTARAFDGVADHIAALIYLDHNGIRFPLVVHRQRPVRPLVGRSLEAGILQHVSVTIGT